MTMHLLTKPLFLAKPILPTKPFFKHSYSKAGISLMLFLLIGNIVSAQDLSSGVTAIEEAATGIEPYFGAIETLVYVIAGIIALLGGVRVYMKWNMGDPDVMGTAAGWFGSAVFLLVAVTFIKGFFGI